MSLGQKGADKAKRNAPGILQKTEAMASPNSAGAPGKAVRVRKQLEISEEMEERLRYYCYINKIKIEAHVLRDALDKYLPQMPREQGS